MFYTLGYNSDPITSPSDRGIHKYLYGSSRIDGIAGDGTRENPFNISDRNKFENLLTSLETGQTLYLMPGTYYTQGNKMANVTLVNSGVNIIGAGKGLTNIIVTGCEDGEHTVALQFRGGNVLVSDLSIDCNWRNQPGVSGSGSMKVQAARADGNNLTFKNLSVKDPCSRSIECFVLTFSNYTENNTARNWIMDNCEVTWLSNSVSATTIGFLAGPLSPVIDSRIQNCFVRGEPQHMSVPAFGIMGSVAGCHICNNTVENVSIGIHQDTHNSQNVMIHDNHFYKVQSAMRLSIGGGVHKDILFYNNIVDLNNDTNYGGEYAALMFSYPGSYPTNKLTNLILRNNIIKTAGVGMNTGRNAFVLSGCHNIFIDNNIVDTSGVKMGYYSSGYCNISSFSNNLNLTGGLLVLPAV